MCALSKLHKTLPHKSYESQSSLDDEHIDEDDVRVCGCLRGRKTYFYRAMIRRNCYEALEKSISNFQGILLCAFSVPPLSSQCAAAGSASLGCIVKAKATGNSRRNMSKNRRGRRGWWKQEKRGRGSPTSNWLLFMLDPKARQM